MAIPSADNLSRFVLNNNFNYQIIVKFLSFTVCYCFATYWEMYLGAKGCSRQPHSKHVVSTSPHEAEASRPSYELLTLNS
jgi:hypothetical protein